MGSEHNKAIDWWEQAAEKGEPYSQYGLGWYLLNGDYTKPDLGQARTLFLKAARQGHPLAARELGRLETNPQLKFEWYQYAAIGLHGDPDARYQLARCYRFGEGVTLSLDEARRWYRRAIEGGHKQAEIELAELDP